MTQKKVKLSLLDHLKGTFTSPTYYLYVPYFSWWTSVSLFFLGMIVAGLFFTAHFGWRILPELQQPNALEELMVELPPEVDLQWQGDQLLLTTPDDSYTMPISLFLLSISVVTPFILAVSTLITGILEIFLLYLLFQLNSIRLTFGQTLRLAVHILIVAQLVTQFTLLLYGSMPLPLFSLTFWVISLYLLFSWQRSAWSLNSSPK